MAKRRIYLNKQVPFVDGERKLTKVTQKAWDDVEEQATALVDLEDDVTNVLEVGNGGTGRATLTDHAVLLGSGSADVDFASPGTAGFILTSNGAAADPTFQAVPSVTIVETIGITVDGGGSVITTGVKGYFRVPYAGTITAATLLADQSGDLVMDVWKDTYANFPPTNADSITGAAPPTLSTANKSLDTTLTGWTTAISAGDVLGYNVDSAATITRVTLQLSVQRT